MPSPMPALYSNFLAIPRERRVVTVGTFDGVHRGHQKLIAATIHRARSLGVPSLVLTFEPVPAQVLRPDHFPGRICSAPAKLRQIARQPINAIAVVDFTIPFSKQTAEAFMARIGEKLDPVELLVGEGFALGKDREGTIERLTTIAGDLGFQLIAVPRLEDHGMVVSSSQIRRCLSSGDVARAGELLGRRYTISGEVVHGAHLGRTIGFPTANVEPEPTLLVPKDGIYAAQASIGSDSAQLPAITYIGTRPTVNTGGRLVETHLLDFDGDLYGQKLSADLLVQLRDDERFESVEAMIKQLQMDEAAARGVLSRALNVPLNAQADESAAGQGD